MLKTFTTCVLLLLFSLNTIAQYTVEGKLVDADNNGVPYASIALSSPQDSSVLQFSIAKEDGSYKMTNVASGDYLLVVACVGYEVEYVPLSVAADVQNKVIVLTSGTVSMKEVMIRAKNIPVLMNGDTIVYNSSSFKTKNNATVEDLIKKLPGVNVDKSGAVTAEGQSVTKVLVNGKEFFGGNVDAATKNIDANMVDKVEVIDKKKDESELSGENNQETEKVINLVLKEKHAKGYFGNIRAGYGLPEWYDAHGNINFFRDETQLTVIGGINNLSKRIYGWRSMEQLNSFEINPLNTWNSFMTWNSGLSTNKGIGANMHIEPIKDMKIDVAYVVTDVQNFDTSLNNSEIYLTENTLFGESIGNSKNSNKSHQINSRIEYKPDTLNRIVLATQVHTLQNSSLYANQTLNFTGLKENISSSAVTKNNGGEDNEKFASKLFWNRKLRKNSKNSFSNSLYYGTSKQNKTTSQFFASDNGFLLPFPTDEAPKINTTLLTDQTTVAATTQFFWQVNEKWSVKPLLEWMRSDYEHVYDWIPTGSEVLTSNSPHGQVQTNDFNYSVQFIYKVDSFSTLYITPKTTQFSDTRDFLTDENYTFGINQLYLTPSIYYHSRKPQKSSTYLSLRRVVVRPQVNLILPVTNTTNPYLTTIGNIELNNYYSNNFYLSTKKFFGLGKFIAFRGWGAVVENPVMSKRTVNDNNFGTLEYVNDKYTVRTSESISYTTPIEKLKLRTELSLSHAYNTGFSLLNNEYLQSENNSYGGSVGLQWYDFDKISFDIEYGINWNKGKIGDVQNNNFFLHDIYSEFIYNPTDRLEFSANLEMELYGKNATVPARYVPILSSEITYSIDTLGKWSIGLEAFDILDRNTQLWRNWNQNSFSQSQSLSITRYLMATIRYKIKKPVKKKPEIKH